MAAEKAWLKAFNTGSKSLQDRLRKVHAKNPEFQSFLGKHGFEGGSSVKQASKDHTVSKEVAAKRAALSNKAYGATTGAKMGGSEGSSDEYKDTTVPLTKDQHSKVQVAKKAAEQPKPAATKAPKQTKSVAKKPLSKDERLKAIMSAARKAKTGERYEIPTEDPDDAGYDDLRDTHVALHGHHSVDESKQHVAEESQYVCEVNEKQIRKDLDSGMSYDAVIGKHANKRLTNTDEIRKVIKQHAWDKRMKKEEAEQVMEMDKSQTPPGRGEQGLALGAKGTPIKRKKAEKDALKAFTTALDKSYNAKKIKEEYSDPYAEREFDHLKGKSHEELVARRKHLQDRIKENPKAEAFNAPRKREIEHIDKLTKKIKEEAERSEYLNSKINEARQHILEKLAKKMGKK